MMLNERLNSGPFLLRSWGYYCSYQFFFFTVADMITDV